jgi:hypothetical protein
MITLGNIIGHFQFIEVLFGQRQHGRVVMNNIAIDDAGF